MQKNIQRISATIFLTLISLLTVAAQEVTVDSLKYTLNTTDHTASVTGYVDGIRNAKIVKTIRWNGKEYKVTSIKDECFHDCTTLTSIVISDGITEIPPACFWGCFDLCDVTIPESVTTLSYWCFSDCHSLKKITLPASTTTLGSGCFRVSGIKEITCLAQTPPTWDYPGVYDLDLSSCNLYVTNIGAYKNASPWSSFANVYMPTDSFKLDVTSKDILIGQTYQPVFRAYPTTANQKVKVFSSNTQVATIDSMGTITAVGFGEADIRYEAYDNSEVFAQIHVQVYNYTDSIRLSAMQTTLAVGQEFKPVISVYPSQASHNLKTSSSNENVAKVDDAGKVSAVGLGEAVIRYESYDNSEVFAQLKVKVYAKTDSIKLDISHKDLIIEKSYKPNITIYPATANQHLTMTTSNPRVATIDSTGVITAVGFGEADIRYEAFDNSAIYVLLHVNVYDHTSSIKLNTVDTALVVGQEFKPTISVYPSQASNNLKISSSNENVAKVDATGKVSAVGLGEAVIRYESYDNSEVFAQLKVKVYAKTDSVKLDISHINLIIEKSYKPNITIYPATANQHLIMTTSNPRVATIDNTGVITAVGFGEADIRYEAFDDSAIYGQLHVNVYDHTASIKLNTVETALAVGQEFKPVISISPSQASQHLKASSSNESVAKVDTAGNVQAVGLGEAVIRYEAYDNSEVFAQLKVKVYAKTDSVKLDISQKDLIIGKSYKPNIIISPAAAIQHLTMTTSNPRVATIDSTGVITAVGFGEADIRFEAFDNSEVYALLHVNVYMPTESVKLDVTSKDILIGQTYQPVFRAYPTTANQKVKVFSSNTQVATADSTGTVTAIAPGEADIRYEAFDNSEVYATLHVNVYSPTDTIVLSDYELHLLVGQSYGNMKAKILPETAMHELDVSSNGAGVAYVNDKGEVIAGEYGECDITFEAKDGTGKSSKCHVYVTYPTENITVSTTELNTNPGEVFKAQQITYKPDLCRHEVRYSSSNEQVATVDSITGDVTAVAPGEADIKYEAKDGTGVFATMHVKVWLRTESITPATTTLSMRLGDVYTKQTVDILPKGAYQKLKLESEDQAIASVDENGVITAVNPGITDILYVAQDSSKVVGKCRVIVCAKNVVYVGGIFYLLKDGKATVTSIYGGEYRGDDPNEIAQYYSGTINIPKTVTYNGMVYDVEEIGSYSFYCQNKLQSIYIPSSVKTISMMAAMKSTSLQLVTVEDNSQLVNIGSEAFEKCTGLLRFTFNGTTLKMKSIDPSAFSECTALQRVRWKGESTLKMIDDYAFYRCTSLNHMEMPNSVVRIGKHTFRYNTSLTDVKLAKRLSIIDEYAFGECGFSHITLPDSIASAQAGAFINNEHLKSITIPAGMEGIGAACFENNAVLDSVTFLTNIHTLTIGNNAFNLCPALERVNIAHLDSWAETNFNNAKANPANTAHHIYKDGKEVLDVVLPQGTLYVNNNAFNGCTYIRSVDMPSSIDHINDDIFVGCDSLKAVYCRAEEVPLFIGVNDPSAMNDVFNRATLYVPTGYEGDYKADDWWSRFYKIQGFNAATGISGISWEDDGKARYYDLSGRPVGSHPTVQGVYIKVENGKRTKVTIK